MTLYEIVDGHCIIIFDQCIIKVLMSFFKYDEIFMQGKITFFEKLHMFIQILIVKHTKLIV